MPSEADARIKIDRLLREAGWNIEDNTQVSTEEAAADGRADYLLKNSRTQPLCILEAKRFAVDPYAAKAQAKAYADYLPAPFILLSNGTDHYLWDPEEGDARPVLGFPRPDSSTGVILKNSFRGTKPPTSTCRPC
jgi:type I site-specific restriction endonuclease